MVDMTPPPSRVPFAGPTQSTSTPEKTTHIECACCRIDACDESESATKFGAKTWMNFGGDTNRCQQKFKRNDLS